MGGWVTKVKFERVLREYKDPTDEMKSEHRDSAKANAHRWL